MCTWIYFKFYSFFVTLLPLFAIGSNVDAITKLLSRLANFNECGVYHNTSINNGDLRDSNPISTKFVQRIPCPSFHRTSANSP